MDLPGCFYCGNDLKHIGGQKGNRLRSIDEKVEIAYEPKPIETIPGETPLYRGVGITLPHFDFIFRHDTIQPEVQERIARGELVTDSFYLFRCTYELCQKLRNQEPPFFGIDFNWEEGRLEKIMTLIEVK